MGSQQGSVGSLLAPHECFCHLLLGDEFSVVLLRGVRDSQMVWMVATAAVMAGRKRPYEIVQRLQRVAGATDVPLSCGEGIPYTHALRYSLCMLTKVCFQMSFSIAVCVHDYECVYACDLMWDLKEDDGTGRSSTVTFPTVKMSPCSPAVSGSEPLLRPNYKSR